MVYNLDALQRNQDWTKKSWDLPPYKSPEFMILFPDLEEFRLLPVYQWAVMAGLIKDDEWVGPDKVVQIGSQSTYEGLKLNTPPCTGMVISRSQPTRDWNYVAVCETVALIRFSLEYMDSLLSRQQSKILSAHPTGEKGLAHNKVGVPLVRGSGCKLTFFWELGYPDCKT